MVRVDFEDLESDVSLAGLFNYLANDPAISMWQGRTVSKEEELELKFTVAEKIHDYIFSLDEGSDEF